MKELLVTEILKPLVRRSGTVLGGIFVGYGVQASVAETIAAGAVAAFLVGIDLWQSHIDRKARKNVG